MTTDNYRFKNSDEDNGSRDNDSREDCFHIGYMVKIGSIFALLSRPEGVSNIYVALSLVDNPTRYTGNLYISFENNLHG